MLRAQAAAVDAAIRKPQQDWTLRRRPVLRWVGRRSASRQARAERRNLRS